MKRTLWKIADVRMVFRYVRTDVRYVRMEVRYVRMNVRYQPKPADMEISGRPLRNHKFLADVTDIFNLENFQPFNNLVLLKSEYPGKCPPCPLLRRTFQNSVS